MVGPLIPRAKRGSNKRTVDVREVVDGIMYVLSTGCQWAALPKDLPPRSTVNSYFLRWEHDRTLDRLHHALYVRTGSGFLNRFDEWIICLTVAKMAAEQERR